LFANRKRLLKACTKEKRAHLATGLTPESGATRCKTRADEGLDGGRPLNPEDLVFHSCNRCKVDATAPIVYGLFCLKYSLIVCGRCERLCATHLHVDLCALHNLVIVRSIGVIKDRLQGILESVHVLIEIPGRTALTNGVTNTRQNLRLPAVLNKGWEHRECARAVDDDGAGGRGWRRRWRPCESCIIVENDDLVLPHIR
jgi:hypothetical protein